MEELIKVTKDGNGNSVVSGRELHDFLEVTERYSSWFVRMTKYGFEENVDYVGCKVFNTLAKQELQDHALTLDMAKEISMIQRTEKGVIYKKGDKWFVYQRYANDGLVGYEIFMPEDKEIRRTLKWTTKGEQFIRSILEDEGIAPVLERPSQMTIEKPQEEYDGDYYTASEIAYKLYLPKGAELLIGKLANEYRLKPVFSDSNKYCRRVVDEYGRETWQYTALGARVIEELIEKMEV